MNQAVDSRQGHGRIRNDPVPLSKWLVGRDHEGALLVSRRDVLEEHACFRLILGDISQIVEDQQAELVQFCDGGLELQVPPCNLQLLN